MGIFSGKLAASFSRKNATSTSWVSSKSTISPLLVAPKGRALAGEIRGLGRNPPVKEIGKEARRRARSNNLTKSRWLTKAMSPSLPNHTRKRCLRSWLGTKWPAKRGIEGGGTTTLWPKSVPQTPQWEQPSKEQSGTVAASKARCKSVFSQTLSMPVSIWSQGRGWSKAEDEEPLSSKLAFVTPTSGSSRSCWDGGVTSPAITFHSPLSTKRYFQLNPDSAIACVQAPKARSKLSHQASIPAPNSQARRTTGAKRRSPLPIKSSIAEIRTSVKFTFTPFIPRNSAFSKACLRSNSAVETECHWKGVWGLGVKLEMVKVKFNRLRPDALHSWCSQRIVSAIPITSTSVSPGKPIIK